METIVVIKSGFSGRSYWVGNECMATENGTGYLFVNYSDKPYLFVNWVELWNKPWHEAVGPVLENFKKYSDTNVDFDELGQIDYVLDSNYQEVGQSGDTIIYTEGEQPRHFKAGHGTVIGHIEVPRAPNAELKLNLAGNVLTPKRIPKIFANKFVFLAEGEKYAEITTSKLIGSGKLVIKDELAVELSVPFAVLACRLPYLTRNRR